MTKTVSAAAPLAGSQLSYTLTVVNNGPSDARNLVVADELPSGLTDARLTAPEGLSCALRDGVVECDGGVLPNGASLTIGVRASVEPGFTGTLTNLARVGSDTPDPVIANNEDTVSAAVRTAADLSLRQTASETSVQPGDSFSYALTVTDAGPSTATVVTVTDKLPAGLKLSGKPSAGCTANGRVVSCAIGRIAPGASVTVLIPVRVDANYGADAITNRATVESSTPDADRSGNTGTAIVTVSLHDPGEPTPTPTPTPSPTASPTPSPEEPVDGELGGAGSPVGLTVVLLALAIAASGVVLVLTARRRGSHQG